LFDAAVTLLLPVGIPGELAQAGTAATENQGPGVEATATSGANVTLFVEAGPALPAGGFDVRTTTCDAARANLQVSGDLNDDGAAVLAHVIDGHVRAGRRFLRLHLGGVRSLGAAATVTIARAHEQLLAGRGTLVLIGVTGDIEAALRVAAPASPLLLLPATAAELM
jgi:anti-anti-sigma regulatory factor